VQQPHHAQTIQGDTPIFPFVTLAAGRCSLTDALAHNEGFRVERACFAPMPGSVRFDVPLSHRASAQAYAIVPRSTVWACG
jgi:hypothetical protein